MIICFIQYLQVVVKSAKNVERSIIITDSTEKLVLKTIMSTGTQHAVVKHLSKKESYIYLRKRVTGMNLSNLWGNKLTVN